MTFSIKLNYKQTMRCLSTQDFIQDKYSTLRDVLLKECKGNADKFKEVELYINETYPTLLGAVLSLHHKKHAPIQELSTQLVDYLQIPKRKHKKAVSVTRATLLAVHNCTWSLVDHHD